MAASDRILDGVTVNCSELEAPIGVSKMITLIDFGSYLKSDTLHDTNFNNVRGSAQYRNLINLFIARGSKKVFESLSYNVNPDVSSTTLENGDLAYNHNLSFIVPSKRSDVKEIVESLGKARMIAVVEDISTGFKEVYGAEWGLKATSISRKASGDKNSNFFQITLSTPKEGKMFESKLPLFFGDFVER